VTPQVRNFRWHKIKADPRYRIGAAVLIALCFVVYSLIYMDALKTDIDAYVIPRVVTAKQSAAIREYLSHYEKYPVVVKAPPFDTEAVEYAGQILNMLKAADWDVTFNTATNDAPPLTNGGLCFYLTDPQNPDPAHDPKEILENAFRAAHIIAGCGGGGTSKLFLVVGHRPLVLGNHETIPSKIKSWISALIKYAKSLRATLLFGTFLFALLVSIIAQVISYLSGPRSNPRRVALGLGVVAVILLGVAGRLGLQDLRNFVQFFDAAYVLPRTVSPAETADLRSYSMNHHKYPVTTKVNPRDREATEYAAQLKNALTAAGWDVTFSTSDADPQTDYGLCILAIGENSKPADDPAQVLAVALWAANIPLNCSGSLMDGAYKLFLLVGRRPVSLEVRG
jgi:hypothetical protein